MNVVNTILNRFAEVKKTQKPHAQLLRYQQITPTTYKVVASLSFDGGLSLNREAISSLFKGEASPVLNSFRQIDTQNDKGQRIAIVGFVTANNIAQEYTEEMASNFKEIAKNVLMDDHDHSMWQVVESGGQKFIRRQHQEDLSELMRETASVNAHQFINRKYTELSTLRVDCAGDFNVVAFVDPEQAHVRYGYICEHASAANGYNHAVLCRDSTEMAYVNEDLVVQCAYNVDPNSQLHQAIKQHVETAGLPDAEVMKNYYSRVYGYDPEYLRELFDTISEQAKV